MAIEIFQNRKTQIRFKFREIIGKIGNIGQSYFNPKLFIFNPPEIPFCGYRRFWLIRQRRQSSYQSFGLFPAMQFHKRCKTFKIYKFVAV